MTDMKMTYQFAGREIAGHENADQKWRQRAKLQENKYSFNRDNIAMKVQIYLTQNTVIHCACGFTSACAQVGKLSSLYRVSQNKTPQHENRHICVTP